MAAGCTGIIWPGDSDPHVTPCTLRILFGNRIVQEYTAIEGRRDAFHQVNRGLRLSRIMRVRIAW
jgi:hypothetical protein